MRTLRLVTSSFLLGVAISFATAVGYAACADMIWVRDDPEDCHIYHRYELVGENCSGGACVCAYLPVAGASAHYQEGKCEDLPPILD